MLCVPETLASTTDHTVAFTELVRLRDVEKLFVMVVVNEQFIVAVYDDLFVNGTDSTTVDFFTMLDVVTQRPA
jgi:hypothetical protein